MHGLYSEANERQADVYQTKEACVGVKFNITEKIILTNISILITYTITLGKYLDQVICNIATFNKRGPIK